MRYQNHIWLVVSTPLKNISSSVGMAMLNYQRVYELENKTVWNHQPDLYFLIDFWFIDACQSETVGKFPPAPPLQLPSIDQHLQ